MIGVVMAGGSGSRMNLDTEKLLLDIHSEPLIIHVVQALEKSKQFSRIICAVSPKSPKTQSFLRDESLDVISTRGLGHAKDLNQVLQQLHDDVLVVPGDLPLLDDTIISEIYSKYTKPWTCIVSNIDFLTRHNLHSEYTCTMNNTTLCYTGINIINSRDITNLDLISEHLEIIDDIRVVTNLNTKHDYDSFCRV